MPGEADLQYVAAILDKTDEFFDRFEERVNRMADRAEGSFQRVDESAQKSGATIGFVAGIVGSLTSKLVQMGSQAVSSIKNFVKSSINLRARVDTLAVSLNVVGRNAGYSAEQMAQFEKDVKSMGITTRSARQSLLQMAQANLDLSRASEIARVAQDAAVIAGVNSSEATMRIVYAIQTLQPRMLRLLGLTVNLEAEYKKYAATAGTTTKALDYQTKQQIALNAVISAGANIAGTYEAAMGSVGKQITSLPRYIEEVQLALGEAFQPALGAQIGYTTDKLKEMLKWLKENEEQLQRLGEQIGMVAKGLFGLLDSLVTFILSLPGRIEESGAMLAKTVGQLLDVADPEEIERRRSKLGEYFGQALTVIASTVAASVKAITEAFSMAFEYIEIFLVKLHLMEGDADKMMADLEERQRTFYQTVDEAALQAAEAIGELTGSWSGISDEIEEATEELENFTQKLLLSGDAIDAVAAAFQGLADEIEMEAAKEAVEEYRKAVEEALRQSHKIADIERRNLERLDKVAGDYAKKRADILDDAYEDELELIDDYNEDVLDAERDKSEKLIDIETDYQRTLEDLRRDFDFDAMELARRRDAVGLRQLARQNQKQLSEAEIARDREREDTQTDYNRQIAELDSQLEEERAKLQESQAERLADLEEWHAEQLQAAENARQRDYENLERSLARQREIEDLHRMWEEEDRRTELEKKLSDMAKSFADMEDLTDTGLRSILWKWEEYFGDLSWLVDEYMSYVEKRMAGAPAPVVGLPAEGGRMVFGQAGQVSQMLTRPPMLGASSQQPWRVPSVSRLPPVAAQRSVERREINLSGDVSGLDPYFQRVLMAGMLEIERNRG